MLARFSDACLSGSSLSSLSDPISIQGLLQVTGKAALVSIVVRDQRCVSNHLNLFMVDRQMLAS